jgi:hypothetical protein
MASIELTQTFTQDITVATADIPTGFFYFQLGFSAPAAGTVFVITNLTINSTISFSNAICAATITAANDNTGTGSQIIGNFGNSTEGTFTNIFNAKENGNVIVNQPYLGFNFAFAATGSTTINIIVSYLQISLTNSLQNNFFVVSGTVPVTSTPTNTVIFTPIQTNSAIISSLVFSTSDVANIYTVEPTLFGTGSNIYFLDVIELQLSVSTAAIFNKPIYLNTQNVASANQLGLYVSSPAGTTALNYYLSYTLDPYA